MGNLDDYNWHRTVGPAAGRPDSFGAYAGQQAYQQDHAHQQGGGYSGHGSGEPPRWLVTNPVKRSLITFAVCFVALNIISFTFHVRSNVGMVLGSGFMLAGMFSILWFIGGMIGYISNLFSKKPEKTVAKADSKPEA